MPDRFALPEDRREACRACGSERRESLTACADCDSDICTECAVIVNDGFEVCHRCAIKRLNQELEVLAPVCTCEWPAWSRYGQQLPLEAA